MEEHQFDFYKTNDMALVAFLRTTGHTPQAVRYEDTTCYWVFLYNDAIVTLVSEFSLGNALAEPREFSRQYGVTKQEMYRATRR